MSALEYLKEFQPWLHSTEGDKLHRPSNSELRRWMSKGSVVINGVKVLPGDAVTFPIREFILFSDSPRGRRTIILDDDVWKERNNGTSKV